MTVRCVTNQSNAPWTSTVEPHHLGAGGGLVDKHQSRRVKRALLSNPASSRAGDVWPSLLRGPQAFFKGDVVPDEKPRQSAAASDDPSPAHRRNRFVQRQIRMLDDQRQQPARVLLQWRDASATRLRCRAAVIAPATEPVDHRTRAHFKKRGLSLIHISE